MSKNIALTLACGDYEILRPLKEGTVAADGVDLTVLTDMDNATRTWRFLRNREFEIAELSSSSYLLARDKGLAFDAIPVFPHRRFRHGFIFVNTGKGIAGPRDLIGRRVGVKSYQTSAIVWMRGILEHHYGVPHKSIDWFSELDEDIPFEPPPDLRLTRLANDESVEAMLVSGELDALLHPDLIAPFLAKSPAVKRLFANHKEEETAYFRTTGILPIMHVIGVRRDIVERHPWVPINLFRAFERAKAAGMKRMLNPRIAPLAWYREAWEEQEAILGPDPWQYGMTQANRKTLETLVSYSHEQGLIKRLPALEELFRDVSEGRKLGGNRF